MTVNAIPIDRSAAVSRRQTIVRRKRTRDFAIVPNEVLADRRLTLEARGALAWLLSRSNNWQVVPSYLREAWAIKDEKIGRDRVYRILDELIASRYVDRNRIHGEGGHFIGFEYVVYDEPIGRGCKEAAAEEEIEAADDADMPRESKAAHEPSDLADTLLPCPEKPETVKPYTAEPYTEKPDTVLRTDSNQEQIPPLPPAPQFADFWTKWKPDPTESRIQAERKWHWLAIPDRGLAIEKIGDFNAACAKRNQRRCHAATYLGEKRFDGFAATLIAGQFHADSGTPQWHRWHEYRIATGQSVAFMETQAAQGKGFTVPREWPPPLPHSIDKASDKPKESLMTEADEKEFERSS